MSEKLVFGQKLPAPPDPVKDAQKWFDAYVESCDWMIFGDCWTPFYLPAFKGNAFEATERTWENEIMMSGLEMDEDGGGGVAFFTCDDEGTAALICDLFNDAPTHVRQLLDEVRRLRGERDAALGEIDNLRRLFQVAR